MAKMIMDWINAMVATESCKGKTLTYEEWCDIRRNGSPEELEEAVERMMAQGGYENLDQLKKDGLMIHVEELSPLDGCDLEMFQHFAGLITNK